MCCGCSKEPSHSDGSFEHLQHMFWLRNKKKKFSITSTLIFGTIGYVTHSFFIHLGIANVNWVFNISGKYLFGYFGFSIGYFCKC